MRRVPALACLFAFAALTCFSTEVKVASPDGRIVVLLDDNRGLWFRVEVDGQPLLQPSRLGLEFSNGLRLGADSKIEKSESTDYDGFWENRWGARRVVRDKWNQLSVGLRESGAADRRFGVVVRVFDDGAALRYDLPEASKLGNFVLYHEKTEFAFAGDYVCWAGEPSACAECLYPQTRLSAIPSRGESGVYRSTLPLVVQTPTLVAAVAESDLRDWAGLSLTGTGTATVRVALAPRGDGRGCVVSAAPRQSPWRVLMIARSAAELVSSDLVATLAAPCQLPDTSWIRPGASAWDPWWTGINPNLPEVKGVWSRGDTKADSAYIDFAAEMGWPYQLVDWFWYENMSTYEIALNLGGKNPERPPVDFAKHVASVDIRALIDHAKQKGVRLIVWLHSYDLDRYGIERACELFSEWGIAGLKIDFMNSESQETVAWYEKVLSTAAQYRLLIDFHGAYKPTGLARTWPNFITQEGVLGNEYNKLDGNKCTPQHTVTLPFTRGVLGPMDFTPGGFLNVPVSQFKVTQPAEVMGTRARQLALPVIYLSPLTVFCDSPENYRGAAGIDFYRALPTVWDETRVLSADIGQSLVLARRSGDRWWLAGINGAEPLKLSVPLKFLSPGSWTLRSFGDPADSANLSTQVEIKTATVDAGNVLDLNLVPAGGFAATLTPGK